MRLVIQRVTEAAVHIGGVCAGSTGPGHDPGDYLRQVEQRAAEQFGGKATLSLTDQLVDGKLVPPINFFWDFQYL